jgi:hypothetical protein
VKTPRFPRGFAKTALEIARQSGHKWPVFTLRPRLLSAVRAFFRYSLSGWRIFFAVARLAQAAPGVKTQQLPQTDHFRNY